MLDRQWALSKVLKPGGAWGSVSGALVWREAEWT